MNEIEIPWIREAVEAIDSGDVVRWKAVWSSQHEEPIDALHDAAKGNLVRYLDGLRAYNELVVVYVAPWQEVSRRAMGRAQWAWRRARYDGRDVLRVENVYRLRLPEHTIWLGGSYKLSILKEVGFSFSRADWSHCGHDAEEIKEAEESMALEWWTEDVGVVVLFKMCSASDIGSLAEKYGSLTVLEGEIILSGAGGVDFSTIGNDRL